MMRPGLLTFGITCYVLFNASFLYLAAFLAGITPKSINDGLTTPLVGAFAINIGVVFLFGFFHSLMAREWFKTWWTQFVSPAAERSFFVLQSSVFLSFAMWQWRPMTGTIWEVSGPAVYPVYAIFVLGIAMVLVSTFLIDHFELFGLKQVWFANTGRSMPRPQFRAPFLYRFCRHPMQLGVVLTVFATPHMTTGHLLFAGLMTLYLVIGLWFEERSLMREFGETYRRYKSEVPMLIPRIFPASLEAILPTATAFKASSNH